MIVSATLTASPRSCTGYRRRSLAVADKACAADLADSAVVIANVAAAETELDAAGRVSLRPSGTEQLIRVMVEAPTQQRADAIAARLAAVVSSV